MPADRLFHPRAGHSRKVNALSDFEFRVWWTYELAADDFGVMRRSAVVLQAANDVLAKRAPRVVEKALDRLVEVGLLIAFRHQDESFVCQLDWQDFQKVRHPRESHQPTPPPEILARCSGETRALFLRRFGNSSETDPSLAGAGGRETANGQRLTANGRGSGVFAGALPREHLTHVACDPTFSRCVPQAVHGKLVNALSPKHNGDRDAADRALREWYPTVWQALADDFVMGDAFRFWQGRFDAAFASKDAPSGSRFGSVEDDAARVRELLGESSS